MPFDDARTPRQSEAGDDGVAVAVAVDARGEGVEAGQIVLPDDVEPVGQALALALGEHGREGADVPGEGVKFGAVRPDSFELESLGLGEGVRTAEDPSGDGPVRGRPGGHQLR